MAEEIDICIMRYILTICICLLLSCKSNLQNVDAIYFNGNIHTMDDKHPEASVMIIDNGKIIAVGDSTLLRQYTCHVNNFSDLKKQNIFPGFIDAHCHFYGYAKTLLSCNLVGTSSWEEAMNKLIVFSKTSQSEWLIGRGWDQNDWADKNYPDNKELNILFPDKPVILKRIDGHAAICNQKALTLAGIEENSIMAGGEFIRKDGKLTGVLIDNAVDMVEKVITPPSNEELFTVLKKAEKECYSLGLTTLADAGLDIETALFLDSLGTKNELSIFLYIMLNPTSNGLKFAQNKGVYENDHTKICSFKLYADGALGSRGAKLKTPYCDRKDHNGMLLNDAVYFDKWCNDIKNTTTYQVNTHCIGDSANRLLLEIYGKYLKGNNDERWRIEHAQIIDVKDFYLFKKFSIIPSVQPTHATSDGPWAEDRLCNNRMKGAYAYQTLLKQNGYLPLGTDFPVEYLNPLFTFYSAVFRENINAANQKPFQLEEKLLPEQALKGMTIWAAKSCRLEHRKGALIAGMDADFIILNGNLNTISKNEFSKVKVLHTIKSGQVVF